MKKFLFPLLMLLILTCALSAQEVILKKGRYVLRETGKTYSGTYKEYDAEKKLVSAMIIKEGLLNDSSTFYYPSGTIKEVRSYKDGLKNGTWKTWNEAGLMTAEAGFENGKKDGAWYVWDDQGNKRYEMYYKNGAKQGTWIIRDEKGAVISREEFK